MHCRASLVPSAVLPSHLLCICPHCHWLHPYMLLSAIYIVDLHSLAELLWYPLLSYICTHCSSAINIVDLRGYALQNLVATRGCPTSYTLHVSYLCHWQHPYVLLICCLHRRPAFAHIAELCCYPLLSYIPTRCLYAINITDLRRCVAEPHWYLLLCYIRTCWFSVINIVDLHGYTLQNLVSMYGCPTFLHAVCLPPLLLATSVRTTCLPSTLSTCIRTRRRASLLPTAVLYSNVLLICHQHRSPASECCRTSLVLEILLAAGGAALDRVKQRY